MQEAARDARYRLLARSGAKSRRAPCADRAYARRSGRDGPASACARQRPGRACGDGGDSRHLSGRARSRSCGRCSILPKARLIATLAQGRAFAFADDPSNRDPRFTRAALRADDAALAAEGLDRRSGWRCSPRRIARAEAALDGSRDQGGGQIVARSLGRGHAHRASMSARASPACRTKSRCGCSAGRVAHAGDEGPVELAKLEALLRRSAAARRPFARFVARWRAPWSPVSAG